MSFFESMQENLLLETLASDLEYYYAQTEMKGDRYVVSSFNQALRLRERRRNFQLYYGLETA